jgi:precorrin-2 dehydrogenase/sirohydrochlorin ferrochelatase
VAALLEAGAEVRVVATRLGEAVTAWRDGGRITAVERAFAPDDLEGVWLAFTATDDPATNRAVFEEGERRRIWVNSADDPANCSFTLMSVVRRGDIQIAIGTGGRSPALAAHLRRRLEEELGPEYEALLDLLAEARNEILAAGGSSEDQDWRAALDSDMLDLIRAGKLDEARERLRRCLSSSSA